VRTVTESLPENEVKRDSQRQRLLVSKALRAGVGNTFRAKGSHLARGTEAYLRYEVLSVDHGSVLLRVKGRRPFVVPRELGR
jgi:hypothetical protein